VTPLVGPREIAWLLLAGRPAERFTNSVGVADLEADEPVQTVPVDYLTVGCPPGTCLQIIYNPATF
jgi:hypothetical protein